MVRTPLYYALKYKYIQVCEILLKNGASPWSDSTNNYKRYINEFAGKIKVLFK